MSMRKSEIIAQYSDPLPCRTCALALDPVGKYSRAESFLCKKHPNFKNRKPSGVLFYGKKCEFYREEPNN